jgi:hypothetical protein
VPQKTSRATQAIKGVASAAVESRQAHAADYPGVIAVHTENHSSMPQGINGSLQSRTCISSSQRGTGRYQGMDSRQLLWVRIIRLSI